MKHCRTQLFTLKSSNIFHRTRKKNDVSACELKEGSASPVAFDSAFVSGRPYINYNFSIENWPQIQ